MQREIFARIYEWEKRGCESQYIHQNITTGHNVSRTGLTVTSQECEPEDATQNTLFRRK